jgi:hypothetical protein
MSFNAYPHVITWIVLAAAVTTIAIYKLVLYARSSRDEFAPHLLAGKAQLRHRAAVAHREEITDKLGKTLTGIVLVYGIAIGVLYLYSQLTGNPSR